MWRNEPEWLRGYQNADNTSIGTPSYDCLECDYPTYAVDRSQDRNDETNPKTVTFHADYQTTPKTVATNDASYIDVRSTDSPVTSPSSDREATVTQGPSPTCRPLPPTPYTLRSENAATQPVYYSRLDLRSTDNSRRRSQHDECNNNNINCQRVPTPNPGMYLSFQRIIQTFQHSTFIRHSL